MSPRIKSAVAWTLRVILALLFALVAISKLGGAGSWIERFAAWGYPAWFVYATGIAELVGAIGLLVPRAVRPAALTLTVIMIGAGITHVMAGEISRVPINAGYIACLMLVLVARATRDSASTRRHSRVDALFPPQTGFAHGQPV